MDDLGDRLARGEQAAFAELFDACADRLHAYLVVRLRSRADADDVIQEAFVRLVRSRGKLARVENLIAYVFKVAHREAARLAGRRTRERDRGADVEMSEVRDAATDDGQAREDAEQLTAALTRLPPAEREVIELKTYGGLLLREIAEVTDTPPGTVASRYRTALDRLRTMLAKNER